MSLNTNLTRKFQGQPTGRTDRDGNMIFFGDFVEIHTSFCIGGKAIGYKSGWDHEVREVLYHEDAKCPTLWLKALNGITDPEDWENSTTGYLIRISPNETDHRITWLKENGYYDETCEFEWLAQTTANQDPEDNIEIALYTGFKFDADLTEALKGMNSEYTDRPTIKDFDDVMKKLSDLDRD